MVWTIRKKESDTTRSGYKALALLQIDLLGSLTCPMQSTDTREATSGFQTSSPLVGWETQSVSEMSWPGRVSNLRIDSPAFYHYAIAPPRLVWLCDKVLYIEDHGDTFNPLLREHQSTHTRVYMFTKNTLWWTDYCT